MNSCSGGWLPWKWTIRLLLSSINTRAAAKDSAGVGTTHAMNDKTTLVQWKVAYIWVRKAICPRLHRGSVAVSCTTQRMILVLRNQRRIFKGMALEGKAHLSLALAQFLRLNAGHSNARCGKDRLVLFLHSLLFLCFLTWYARTLWECILLHPCIRQGVI